MVIRFHVTVLVLLPAMLMAAQPARAECHGAASAIAAALSGCAVENQTGTNLTASRPAQAADGAAVAVAVMPVRYDRPETTTLLHYICTPSGFGQTASCSIR